MEVYRRYVPVHHLCTYDELHTGSYQTDTNVPVQCIACNTCTGTGMHTGTGIRALAKRASSDNKLLVQRETEKLGRGKQAAKPTSDNNLISKMSLSSLFGKNKPRSELTSLAADAVRYWELGDKEKLQALMTPDAKLVISKLDVDADGFEAVWAARTSIGSCKDNSKELAPLGVHMMGSVRVTDSSVNAVASVISRKTGERTLLEELTFDFNAYGRLTKLTMDVIWTSMPTVAVVGFSGYVGMATLKHLSKSNAFASIKVEAPPSTNITARLHTLTLKLSLVPSLWSRCASSRSPSTSPSVFFVCRN